VNSGSKSSLHLCGSVEPLEPPGKRQPETVREIALAWFLTLPVVMALSGGLYWLASLVTG
jgi:phosphate/sulfate permease